MARVARGSINWEDGPAQQGQFEIKEIKMSGNYSEMMITTN